MEGKKILILTYYWPPAGGVAVQRWLKFTRYLKAQGWTPVIFTAKDADYPVLNEALGQQVPTDVEVHHIPIPEPRKWVKFNFGKKNSSATKDSNIDGLFYIKPAQRTWKQNLVMWIRANLFIPDARVMWVPNCVDFISTYIQDHGGDFLVTTGPPHSTHLSGFKIKKKTGIKWVADFRDPWTDIEYFDFLPLTKRSERKHYALEKTVVTEADGVITVSPYWTEKFQLFDVKRITVLTNGYDAQDFEGIMPHDTGKFVISHAGTIQGDRFPLELFQALKELFQEHPEIKDDIVVELAGKIDPRLEDVVSGYELQEVIRIKGFLTHQEALQLMIDSGLLLLLVNKVERNERGRMTGKLFEYLYARRPVLMIGPVQSDPADIIRQTHAGHVCEWQDVGGIKDVIFNEYLAYKGGKRKQDTSGIESFSREKITGRLIAFLRTLHQ